MNNFKKIALFLSVIFLVGLTATPTTLPTPVIYVETYDPPNVVPGTTDETAAFTAAINKVLEANQHGIILLQNRKYYHASSFTIPSLVTVQGGSFPNNQVAPTNFSPLLISGTGSTITVQGVLRNVAQVRYGINLNPANLQAVYTNLGNYSGTGITLGTYGILENAIVLGNTTGIATPSGGAYNFYIHNVRADNTNCISITQMHNYSWADDVNCQPLLVGGSSNVSVSVSGVVTASDGSGLIEVTTSTAHTLATGNVVIFYGIGGYTGANGRFTVTVIDATHLELQNSIPAPSVNATTTTGSNIILVSSTAGLASGQTFTGTNISGTQTITNVNTVLNEISIASGSGVTGTGATTLAIANPSYTSGGTVFAGSTRRAGSCLSITNSEAFQASHFNCNGYDTEVNLGASAGWTHITGLALDGPPVPDTGTTGILINGAYGSVIDVTYISSQWTPINITSSTTNQNHLRGGGLYTTAKYGYGPPSVIINSGSPLLEGFDCGGNSSSFFYVASGASPQFTGMNCAASSWSLGSTLNNVNGTGLLFSDVSNNTIRGPTVSLAVPNAAGTVFVQSLVASLGGVRFPLQTTVSAAISACTSATENTFIEVTDALNPVNGNAITSGGSSHVWTWCNGTLPIAIVGGTTATAGTTAGTFTAGNDSRISSIFTPEQYGADPTGVADSTSAIQSALTAASSFNGTVQMCGRYLQNSANITQPAAVAVVGCESNFPGVNWTNRNYSTTKSTIVQNPSYKWIMGTNARLARLTFISSAWTQPTSFASLVAQATTNLQGTAVELASDVAVDDVLALGYATGIHSTNVSRFNLNRVNIDANNCFNLNNMFDISTISNIECSAFTTYNTTWANANWPVTAVSTDGNGQIILTVGSPAVSGTAISTLNGSTVSVLGPQAMGLTNHYSGVAVSGNNVTLVGSQLNPTATAAINSGSTQMTITTANGIGNTGIGYNYVVTCPSGIPAATTVSINNARSGIITLSAAATATVASQTCTFTAPSYTTNTATLYFNEVRRAGDGITLTNTQGLRIIAPFVIGHDTGYRATTGATGTQFVSPQTDYNTVVNDPQNQSYEEDGSNVWSYFTGGSLGSTNTAVVINRTGLFPTTFAGTAMNAQANGGYLLWMNNGRADLAGTSDTGTNGQVYVGSSVNGLRLSGVDWQGVPKIQYQTQSTASVVYTSASDIYNSLVFDGGTGNGPRIHGIGANGMYGYLSLPGSGGRWVLGTDTNGASFQTIDPGAPSTNIVSATAGTFSSPAALLSSNNGALQVAGVGSNPTYLGSSTSIVQIQGAQGLAAASAATATPATGGSITLTANEALFLVQGTASLGSLTVNYPASPTDRQNLCLVTQVSISTLTLTSLGTAAFDSNPAYIPAHSELCYRYWSSNNTWIQEPGYTSPAISQNGINANNYLVCDGSTDNATNIANWQTAIAASPSKAGYIPPQVSACMTSANLTIISGETITAIPGTVTIKATPTSTASPLLFNASSVSGVYIYGITFDGNLLSLGSSSSALTQNVTQLYSVSNVIFDHVTWQNTRGIALEVSTSTTNSGVRDSCLSNIGNYWQTSGNNSDQQQGIAFSSGSGNSSNFVTGTCFNSIGLDALSIANQASFSATNNRFYQVGGRMTNGGACIYANTDTDLHISGNQCNTPYGNGYDAITVTGFDISSNSVNSAGGGGIQISSASYGTITGNKVLNSNQIGNTGTSNTIDGALVFGGTINAVAVTGNILSDSQSTHTSQYGVEFLTGTVTTTLTNSTIDYSNIMIGNVVNAFGGGASYLPAGLSCSGTPTSSFATVNGVVTHC